MRQSQSYPQSAGPGPQSALHYRGPQAGARLCHARQQAGWPLLAGEEGDLGPAGYETLDSGRNTVVTQI